MCGLSWFRQAGRRLVEIWPNYLRSIWLFWVTEIPHGHDILVTSARTFSQKCQYCDEQSTSNSRDIPEPESRSPAVFYGVHHVVRSEKDLACFTFALWHHNCIIGNSDDVSLFISLGEKSMSVELVGIGSRMVLPELPALIGPGTFGQTRNDEVDANYLCLISQVEGQLVVWDLGGKGNTFVNGSRVTRAILKESDTVRFGGSEFRVHSEPPPRRYLHGVRN